MILQLRIMVLLLISTCPLYASTQLETYFQNKLGTWKLYDGKMERLDPKGKILESNSIISEITDLKKEGNLWIQTKAYCLKDKPCVTQINKFEIAGDKLLQDATPVEVISVSSTTLTIKLDSPKGFIMTKIESITGNKLSEEFKYFMKANADVERGIQLSKKMAASPR
jgi:hypothetical protein